MKTQMEVSEIVNRYQNAQCKSKQIKILAQLNACDEETIKQKLIEGGIPEKDVGKKKGRPKKENPAEKAKREAQELIAEETSNESRTDTNAFTEDVEVPVLSPEEEKQVEIALSIPKEVREACHERLLKIDNKLADLEREKKVINDFLEGKKAYE